MKNVKRIANKIFSKNLNFPQGIPYKDFTLKFSKNTIKHEKYLHTCKTNH